MSRLYSIILKKMIMPVADYAMKTKVMFYYYQILQMQRFSNQEILEWQNKELRKLITHAYNNTEYYNNLFKRLNIITDDIRDIEDLKCLPILSKDDVRKNYDKLVSKNIEKIPHIESATGGSTGDPVKFLLDKNSWSFSNANNIVNWEKSGYKYGNKYIALGSTSLFLDKQKSLKHLFYYKLKNKIGLNGINMSDQVCKYYIELIRKKKIKYIYGYASAIYLLAKYVLENNIDINILVCFPTSEILTNLYRDTIQNAFKCKIIDCYGAHDGGITAFEHKRGFYEVGYNSLITIKECDANNTGRVLLTDLLNYAMPLINYELGDELQIDEEKCKDYLYNGLVIHKVFGRMSDILRLENGRILTGPGFTILFKDLPVEAYSIEKNGVNSLLCKIKKLSTFSKKNESIIFETFKKQAGQDCQISIEYVDDFHLTNSGKKRYFITN